MREIISINVGQCGNQLGTTYMGIIADEHGMDGRGVYTGTQSVLKRGIHVFMREASADRFTPRVILCDLEPNVVEGVLTKASGKLYDPANVILGHAGAGNNWAKGFYTDGNQLAPQIMDVLRKEAEASDSLQGIQICHSLGGGTGSGLGTLLISRIREEYPDRILNTQSVTPAANVSETVVEPYNTVLAAHRLTESADIVQVLDNAAQYDICKNILQFKSTTYKDLNQLAAAALSSVTSGLRFPGQLNMDLRKLACNLVPFPRLHFVSLGFAPLSARGTHNYKAQTVAELTSQLFDPKTMLCQYNPAEGIYLTVAAIYRGAVATREIERCLARVQESNESFFAPWVPNNVKAAVCDIPPRGLKIAACFLGNTTAMQQPFQRFTRHFELMYNRKAFLHWYMGEGMDQMEFTEASSNLQDLIAEYQQYQEVKEDD